MKASEIKVGETYLAKGSGPVVQVTGLEEVGVRSAQWFRALVRRADGGEG